MLHSSCGRSLLFPYKWGIQSLLLSCCKTGNFSKKLGFSILQTRALRNLYEVLEYYKLSKFMSYNEKCYPRLVRTFHANLGVMPKKLLCYVINKKIVLDVWTLAELFEMNDTTPCKLPKDFQDFSREEALKFLFLE